MLLYVFFCIFIALLFVFDRKLFIFCLWVVLESCSLLTFFLIGINFLKHGMFCITKVVSLLFYIFGAAEVSLVNTDVVNYLKSILENYNKVNYNIEAYLIMK